VKSIIDPTSKIGTDIEVADIDRDGKLDLAAANMAQGDDPDPVRIYLNSGRGRRWRIQTLAATGSHSMRIVDVDGNGAPSLFGGNHQSSKLELWRNGLRRPKPRP
jgi:hypothetical protein